MRCEIILCGVFFVNWGSSAVDTGCCHSQWNIWDNRIAGISQIEEMIKYADSCNFAFL